MQKKYPTLSKAPIILAIMEIRFSPRPSLKVTDLKSLKGVFKETFPNHSELSSAEIKFSAGGDKTPVSIKNTGVTGQLFTSADKKHEFNLTIDTFNFKQHGPYGTWEEFKDAGLAAWEKCYQLIEPSATSRISIRYINNIEIPIAPDAKAPQLHFFKTFIANTGSVVNTKPISNYFIRYTHPAGDDNIRINFAQELKIGPPGTFPFIIDIDVLFEKQNSSADIQFISNKLDELREIKNHYFFDNLTEHTYNLIK